MTTATAVPRFGSDLMELVVEAELGRCGGVILVTEFLDNTADMPCTMCNAHSIGHRRSVVLQLAAECLFDSLSRTCSLWPNS